MRSGRIEGRLCHVSRCWSPTTRKLAVSKSISHHNPTKIHEQSAAHALLQFGNNSMCRAAPMWRICPFCFAADREEPCFCCCPGNRNSGVRRFQLDCRRHCNEGQYSMSPVRLLCKVLAEHPGTTPGSRSCRPTPANSLQLLPTLKGVGIKDHGQTDVDILTGPHRKNRRTAILVPCAGPSSSSMSRTILEFSR